VVWDLLRQKGDMKMSLQKVIGNIDTSDVSLEPTGDYLSGSGEDQIAGGQGGDGLFSIGSDVLFGSSGADWISWDWF
jgi:Ca2+-binding RTX toxin-like protein